MQSVHEAAESIDDLFKSHEQELRYISQEVDRPYDDA